LGQSRIARSSLPLTDPLGLESGVVRVVAYDPRWADLFTAEAKRIGDHCGASALRLEHIGGTSIPGMWAKPIVDILAGRPGTGAIQAYVSALTQAGYEHRGERGVPGREYFRRGEPRSYHLHLVEEGSRLWLDYLAFRDHLRSHSETARHFATLKRTLAARFPRDRDAYLAAKSALVEEILLQAAPDSPRR
jgi:GrpB-like predicted nucleotidyltransferase (UPF0157 family)